MIWRRWKLIGALEKQGYNNVDGEPRAPERRSIDKIKCQATAAVDFSQSENQLYVDKTWF